jgi:hypothetical protein
MGDRVSLIVEIQTMKTVPSQMRIAAVLFLLLAGTGSAADWGTIKYHRITGTQGSWTMRLEDGRLVPAAFIDVGPDCSSLTIETGTDGHGGRGNCNLYVRFGLMPASGSYLKRSVRTNYKERIFIRQPAPGRYFIRMFAKSSYRACLRIHIKKLGVSDGGLFELRRCNWERDIRGIRHLSLNSKLQLAAERHAHNMITYGYYSHTGRTPATRTVAKRVARAGYSARSSAENISRSMTYLNDIFTKWMKNPASRANILDPNMRQVGFGYWNSAGGTSRRSVAVFAQPQ